MKKLFIAMLSFVIVAGSAFTTSADEWPTGPGTGTNPFGWEHVHDGIDRHSIHNPVIGWINGGLGYVCSGNGSVLGCTFFENKPIMHD